MAGQKGPMLPQGPNAVRSVLKAKWPSDRRPLGEGGRESKENGVAQRFLVKRRFK